MTTTASNDQADVSTCPGACRQGHQRTTSVGLALALWLSVCGGGSSSTETTPVPTNSAPTGRVPVSGSTMVGSALSASQMLADTDGLGLF
jgi:hypothetical protein